MLYRRLIINGTEYQLAVSQCGTGVPGAATPGVVGVLYMNTNDGSLYKCTGAADGNYVWQAVMSHGGLSDAQIDALNSMFQVCAFAKDDVSAEYNAFRTAFGITDAMLTSISVVYSGGNVTAGTSVNALTGVAVTAHYSDGTAKSVTDYLLSGTIAEGDNTITVSYGSMTATFTVTGIASTGAPAELTGISATYSGGDVAVDTNLSDLTGIVVTAHYSDGSTQTVTAYTLSGTISEGENTITASYCGMTATFTVTGIASTGAPAELTGISATYSGGDVAVGTNLSDLTGIVVTAHYSNGSSKPITGYTLSGTIAEGANTITVSYAGMTATFTVTGVAESGGETETDILFHVENAEVNAPTDTGVDISTVDMDYSICFNATNKGSVTSGSVNWLSGLKEDGTVTNSTHSPMSPEILVYNNNGAIRTCIAKQLQTSTYGNTSLTTGEYLKLVLTHIKDSGQYIFRYIKNFGNKVVSEEQTVEVEFTEFVVGTNSPAYPATVAYGITAYPILYNDLTIYNRVLSDDEITSYLG